MGIVRRVKYLPLAQIRCSPVAGAGFFGLLKLLGKEMRHRHFGTDGAAMSRPAQDLAQVEQIVDPDIQSGLQGTSVIAEAKTSFQYLGRLQNGFQGLAAGQSGNLEQIDAGFARQLDKMRAGRHLAFQECRLRLGIEPDFTDMHQCIESFVGEHFRIDQPNIGKRNALIDRQFSRSQRGSTKNHVAQFNPLPFWFQSRYANHCTLRAGRRSAQGGDHLTPAGIWRLKTYYLPGDKHVAINSVRIQTFDSADECERRDTRRRLIGGATVQARRTGRKTCTVHYP